MGLRESKVSSTTRGEGRGATMRRPLASLIGRTRVKVATTVGKITTNGRNVGKSRLINLSHSRTLVSFSRGDITASPPRGCTLTFARKLGRQFLEEVCFRPSRIPPPCHLPPPFTESYANSNVSRFGGTLMPRNSLHFPFARFRTSLLVGLGFCRLR